VNGKKPDEGMCLLYWQGDFTGFYGVPLLVDLAAMRDASLRAISMRD